MIFDVIMMGLLTFSHAAPSKKITNKPDCLHNPKIAQAVLSAIYLAETEIHAETNTYSEDFIKIGYSPSKKNLGCDAKNWEFEIAVDSDGQQFIAQARSKLTQNVWIIDHNKKFVKVY